MANETGGVIGTFNGEIFIQCRYVQVTGNLWMLENGLHFGSKHEETVLAIPVQRLDAIAVARQEQQLLNPVVNREREHAIKSVNTLLAPFFVGMHDDFGIGAGMELVPF